MKLVEKKDIHKIAHIFEGWNETLIWSCLQGYMGNAWIDNEENPNSAQILTADFCFFAGIPNEELVKNIPNYYKRDFILMVGENEEWNKLIENIYPNNHNKFYRYAIKKEGDIFDRKKLREYANSLPKEYKIIKIDEKIYNAVKKEEWSEDLCSQFETYGEYERLGIGFVAVYENKIVSGVSSYTVYDKGIEIEIDTKKEFRRRGLALACAATLILECIDKGIYPSWDAANRGSVSLSEKLGYHFDKEYVTYEISWRNK